MIEQKLRRSKPESRFDFWPIKYMPQLRPPSIHLSSSPLLPELAEGYLFVVMLVEDLGRRQLKVLLCDMNSPLA